MANRLFGIGGILGPPAPGMGATFNPLAQMGAIMASRDPAGAMADLGNMNMRGQALYQNLLAQAQQQAMLGQHQAAQRQLEAERLGIQREGLGLREDQFALAQQQAAQPPANVREMQWALSLPDGPEKDAVFRSMGMGPAIPKIGDTAGLRKEYQSQSKPWIAIRDSYERMEAAEPTKAGDTALVFSFLKMLDPGSTITEGERADAGNAGGVPEQVRAEYNRLLTGEPLLPETRDMYRSQGRALMQRQLNWQRQREAGYRDLAVRQGMDPQNVIRDLLGDYRDMPLFESPGGVSVQQEPSAGADADLPRPTSQAEYDALPVGTEYIAPNGEQYRKR